MHSIISLLSWFLPLNVLLLDPTTHAFYNGIDLQDQERRHLDDQLLCEDFPAVLILYNLLTWRSHRQVPQRRYCIHSAPRANPESHVLQVVGFPSHPHPQVTWI